MTLRELHKTAEFYISQLRDYEEDPHVLITLEEPSIGSRASTGVQHASMGFDWEHGQFRIQPAEKLCRFGRRKDDPVSKLGAKFDGRSYYFCPRCGGGHRVKKDDRYCSGCGQRLSDEIKWKDW
jgi:hypothetical protein